MNRPPLSRLWHGLLALVVLFSLVAQTALTIRGGTGPVSTRVVRLFSYFTIQSNILVLAAAASLALHPGRDGRVWRVLRLDAVLGIVITGLVYAIVLAAQNHPHGLGFVANFGLHYLAPWCFLLGWLVFGPRPRIDPRTLAWSALWPAGWIGYTLAHGAVTHWYPYPFTDVSVLGYPAALRNLSFIVLITVLLAAVLHLLDRRLPTAGEQTSSFRLVSQQRHGREPSTPTD